MSKINYNIPKSSVILKPVEEKTSDPMIAECGNCGWVGLNVNPERCPTCGSSEHDD